MRVRLRVVILLSVLYLSLVGFLYRYLWRARALDGLFDGPGNQVPHSAQDLLEFNLHRVNPPHFAHVLAEPATGTRDPRGENTTGSAQPLGKAGSSSPSSSAAQRSGFLRTSRPGSPPRSAGGEEQRSMDVSSPHSNASAGGGLNLCLHAFYYAWYGNVETDGRYYHWNHRYLPHWQAEVTRRYPQGRHAPPDDVGASFFPKLGCYSSRDPRLMEGHMLQLVEAGVGVISVSWYPGGLADEEGFPPDPLLPELLGTALKYGIKVTIHIEPYEGRTPLTVAEDLKYIHKSYFSHPAFYRFRKSGKLMPLVYVYDSYLSPVKEWGKVLLKDGPSTIRGKDHDCAVIGLLVEAVHKNFILDGGFDGFYTYFASNIFTYGSKTSNWPQLAFFAKQHDLLFIPSFGPGYEDLRVRPWNDKNARDRQNGDYYRTMSSSALKHSHGGIVSITSFNEWHEGTQIEPAVPKQIDGYSYLDYAPEAPEFYLQLTSEISRELQCSAL